MVFNNLISIYEFKSFRKNLKFKKYNIGITKFIKNRKKYIIRKRLTSNLTWYYNISTWTKNYSLTKQYVRYSHFFSSTRYCFISLTLSFLICKNPTIINLTSFNYSNIPGSIILNKSLFLNYNYLYFKKSLKSSSKSLFFFNKIGGTNNYFLKLFLLDKYIQSTNSNTVEVNTSLEFSILLKFLLKYILNYISLYRRLFSFFCLKAIILDVYSL